MIKASFVLFCLFFVATEIKSDGNHVHADPAPPAPADGNYDLPPPPADSPPVSGGVPPPVGVVPPPPIGGGFLGFPGFGFSKSLNLNAGAGIGGGPFVGGFGGGPGFGGGAGFGGGPGFAGGPPPPPIGGDIPPVGGFGGFGLGGPGYLPSTWLGSALGAKGDFLFPCVIVIFFLVGVWVVIQFLLTLLVPLIGAKLGALGAIGAAVKKVRRSAEQESKDENLTTTTSNVTRAIDSGDKY